MALSRKKFVTVIIATIIVLLVVTFIFYIIGVNTTHHVTYYPYSNG